MSSGLQETEVVGVEGLKGTYFILLCLSLGQLDVDSHHFCYLIFSQFGTFTYSIALIYLRVKPRVWGRAVTSVIVGLWHNWHPFP